MPGLSVRVKHKPPPPKNKARQGKVREKKKAHRGAEGVEEVLEVAEELLGIHLPEEKDETTKPREVVNRVRGIGWLAFS